MNYTYIADHLNNSGFKAYNEETNGVAILRVKISIEEQELTLIHFHNPTMERMPSFLLENASTLPRLAHTLLFGENDLASICVNVPDSVSVNYEVPKLAFEESLKRHIKLLRESLSNPVWNKQELLREFLAGWFNIQGNLYSNFTCVTDQEEFKVLEIFKPKIPYGFGSIHIGISESLKNSDPFSVSNRIIAGREASSDLGCILPLNDLECAPACKADLKQWYLRALSKVTPTDYQQLSKTLGNTRKNQFWIIFNAKTPSGLTWFGVNITPIKNSNGKKTLPLSEGALKNWELNAINVNTLNNNKLMPRSGAFTELQTKSALIVGCGSVGSQIAMQLASAGIGVLSLVDSDIISIDNLYRHATCVPLHLNLSKVTALYRDLIDKYPWLKVIPSINTLNFIKNESLLNSFDIIIIAIGSPTQERLFHDFFLKHKIETPCLNTWLEGYGVGGHAILELPETKGCMRCAYVNPIDLTRGLVSNLNFIKSNQNITKNLAGCGDAFLPFSNLAAIQTALIASDLILKFLRGHLTKSAKISWKGNSLDAEAEGLSLTDRYYAFNQSLMVTPLYNNECDICNDY